VSDVAGDNHPEGQGMSKVTMSEPAPIDLYYDPFDYQIDRDPHPVWKRMRNEAPLYYNERFDFYALSRFEDVSNAARDVKTYKSGHGTVLDYMSDQQGVYGPVLLFSDPPEHTRLRKLVSNYFRPQLIARLENTVREVAADLLDAYVGAEGFDYVADFGAQLPAIVICSILGIDRKYADILRRSIDSSHHLDESGPELLADGEQPEFAVHDQTASLEEFADLADLDGLVEWRKRDPGTDIVSEFANAVTDDGTGDRPLTRQEIVTYVNHLVGAGVETVARLLSFSAVILARNPDQRDLLVAEPGLITNGVEELLRYEAPSPVNTRWVEEDVILHGHTVARGSKMMLLNGSAGRDERAFTDPDRFDVRRSFDRHLAFGYGLHFCLGAALARLEARAAWEETLKRFPRWEVVEEGMVPVHTSHIRGFHQVPIRFG
jgi:cytochrome P450